MAGQAGEASTTELRLRLLDSPTSSADPLIICFHGSGERCSPSWDALTSELRKTYRVLLPDRGSRPITPTVFALQLSGRLRHTTPPYVLIAHSYGGTFARYFLHAHPEDVAGMVLVETGQETALDPEIEQRQYSRQVLGSKPLSVIRGNSLIEKFKALEESDANKQMLEAQRKLLSQWDRQDERLKKAQLALSRNTRYVHIPDCGHHVIRDRPDIVVEEVKWVMENLSGHKNSQNSGTPSSTTKSAWTQLSRYLGLSKG